MIIKKSGEIGFSETLATILKDSITEKAFDANDSQPNAPGIVKIGQMLFYSVVQGNAFGLKLSVIKGDFLVNLN